jgi:hypothetical protein
MPKLLLPRRFARLAKSNPQPGDVYVSAPLTNIAVAYAQDPANFVADKVFPLVPVQQQTGKYLLYDKGSMLRDEARVRAPGTESAGAGWTVSYPSYACVNYEVHKDIDDPTRANYPNNFSADRDATLFVTQKLLIRRERQWVSNFFGAGIWGTDLTGVASGPTAGQFLQWDQAGSTPLNDINLAKKTALAAGCPNEPNTMAVDYQTYLALTQNAAIQARFQYTTAESITADMLARYFNVARFFILRSVYASSLEGASTVVAFIAGKACLLCYTPDAPSLQMPSAGYTFSWEGYVGAGAGGIQISTFRMQHLKSDRVEGAIAYDQRQVAADCGVFLSGTIA